MFQLRKIGKIHKKRGCDGCRNYRVLSNRISRRQGVINRTLRVKLPDIGIHILGIWVNKRKDNWHFSLPSRQGIHHKTGESVRYPIVLFEDREKQQALIIAIREKGSAFIERRLADTENPLVFPKENRKEVKQDETSKARDSSLEAKKTAFIEKAAPIKSIVSKEWRDLPPLQQKPTARYLSKFGR